MGFFDFLKRKKNLPQNYTQESLDSSPMPTQPQNSEFDREDKATDANTLNQQVEYISPTPLIPHYQEDRFQQKQNAILDKYSYSNQDSDKTMLDELNSHSMESSLITYDRYCNEINNVNPLKLDLSDADMGELTSVEKAFLKYLNSLPIINPPIAQKWYYEHGFSYEHEIKKFMGQNLLEISNFKDISMLTVNELKDLLATKKIPKSGKKADLILKVTQNFTTEELKSDQYYYKLTQEGITQTQGVVRSATDNLELEDKCIQLLSQHEVNEAYREIAKYRMDKPGSFGFGMDWKHEYKKGLNPQSIESYKLVLDQCLNDNTMLLTTCVTIFCTMMGLGINKSDILEKRILGSISEKDIAKNSHSNEEDEIKFTNEVKQRLSNSGLNISKLNINRMSDNTLNFEYANCQIGRIKLKGRSTSLQILTKDDVEWIYDQPLDYYLQKISKWIKLAKIYSKDDY